MSQAGNFDSTTILADIETLTGNAGGAVGPDGSGNVDLLGTNPMTVTGTPGSNLLTITVEDATVTQKGVSELATDAEAIAGTDSVRTIVPTSLKAKLGTQTDHGVLVGSGDTAAITALAVGATGTVLKGVTGADPAFGAVDLTADVTGILPVANGGTGANTLTDHGILVGSGTGAVTVLGAATNGQIPIGSTGADPVLATITSTGGTVDITNGAGTINLEVSGGIEWAEVTAATQAMAVNYGYITNNGAGVTCTLPATAAIGDIIEVVGKNAAGWTIAQNAGQTIHFIATSTTTGVGGSLASTQQYDGVRLVCITANTDFAVKSSVGNITVV